MNRRRNRNAGGSGSDNCHRDRLYDVRLTAIICCILVVGVGVVFGKTLFYEFVNYDDNTIVYGNTEVARGLSWEGLFYAVTTRESSMWYPLTWLSLMLDSQIYGIQQPWGFHLTNILLHAATTVVLFLALKRMTGNFWMSAMVTLLFAIHPLQAESVAWVGERKTPLSGLFFAATLYAYTAYAQSPFSPVRYLVMAVLFSLGLLAKPTLVTLPFLLLLLDYWPLNRWRPQPSETSSQVSIRRLLVEKLPLFAISLGASAAAVWSQSGNIVTVERASMASRCANAIVSYAVYLGEFFYPIGLAAFYPRPDVVPAWHVAIAAATLIGITLAAIAMRRTQPAFIIGWLWFLGALLPMVGLVAIGSHVRADRYTYLPHIGLAIAVVSVVALLGVRLFPNVSLRWRVYAGAGTIAILVYGAIAWRQTSYWKNSETLWTHALQCTTRNPIANICLANVLSRQGDLDEAVDHYRKALRFKPDHAEAHNNLANILIGRGDVEEAIEHYSKAVEFDPNYAEAHNNLAFALARGGKIDDAIRHYEEALRIQPELAVAHKNFGTFLAAQHRPIEAISQLEAALKSRPDDAEVECSLANLLAAQGQLANAIFHYRRVLKIDPDSVETGINLADALAATGQVGEAMPLYRQALEKAQSRNNRALVDVIQARIRLQSAKVPPGQVP